MRTDKIRFQQGGGQPVVFVNWTEKAEIYEKISITGTRWADKFGNTYHRAYIAGLNKNSGKWEDLGDTEIHHGYDNHFAVTAGEWLANNGYLEETKPTNGYSVGSWWVREKMDIEIHVTDVSRKRDL